MTRPRSRGRCFLKEWHGRLPAQVICGNASGALGMIEESFAAGANDNDPDWVYWLNREEIDVMAGRCYTELRNPGRAVSLLTSAIAR